MQNSTYDKLKLASLILAPVITFVGSVCATLNVPHATEITAVLAAADVCLGAIVKILADRYHSQEGDE